jgi:uncharacterized membrane protein (Fun14 family)
MFVVAVATSRTSFWHSITASQCCKLLGRHRQLHVNAILRFDRGRWGEGGGEQRRKAHFLHSGLGSGLFAALVMGEFGTNLHSASDSESSTCASDPEEWAAERPLTWYEWATGSGPVSADPLPPSLPSQSSAPVSGAAGVPGTNGNPPSAGGAAGGSASAALDAINLEELGVQVSPCKVRVPPSGLGPFHAVPKVNPLRLCTLQISLGSVAGFCSGYALKKVSKAAAIVIGLGFVGIQLARHNGLISDVNWGMVQEKLVQALDADGDGQVSVQDLKTHLGKLIDVLGFNLPSGAAFGAAFFLGLRYG